MEGRQILFTLNRNFTAWHVLMSHVRKVVCVKKSCSNEGMSPTFANNLECIGQFQLTQVEWCLAGTGRRPGTFCSYCTECVRESPLPFTTKLNELIWKK